MKHLASPDDIAFVRQFEDATLPAAGFNHRAHLRVAYTYLCTASTAAATRQMKAGLRHFLDQHGVDPAKFHETMTCAWVLAVRHFMACAGPAASFNDFIADNPRLLQASIMNTHYTKECLFSAAAARAFIEPDLTPIPRYAH